MSHTFTAREDDKFAAPTPLPVEVMTVKPSGFINYRGMFPQDALPVVKEGLKAYYAEKGRPEPVIYTRIPGEGDWVAEGDIVIPDELPEGFTA